MAPLSLCQGCRTPHELRPWWPIFGTKHLLSWKTMGIPPKIVILTKGEQKVHILRELIDINGFLDSLAIEDLQDYSPPVRRRWSVAGLPHEQELRCQRHGSKAVSKRAFQTRPRLQTSSFDYQIPLNSSNESRVRTLFSFLFFHPDPWRI